MGTEKKGKIEFTQQEIEKIEELIKEKLRSSSDKQKSIRDKIRNIGFYWTDFYTKKDHVDYNIENFKKLISDKRIFIKK